ncbi:MAG: thermonuclease family protein [Deltaproteobacteria bacterium]|nr:thermonuclease family protein [Deltaproteobacteria bacterium]
MAKLKLKNEWKLWAGVGLLFLLLIVYLYWISRPPTEGGQPLWRVTQIVDGRTLKLRGSGKIIEFRLIGLNVPASEEVEARDFLTKTLTDKWVRIKIERDKQTGPKEGFAYISGEDITARMIRLGLATIAHEEKDFDVRPYIELEQEAQNAKRGLWNK